MLDIIFIYLWDILNPLICIEISLINCFGKGRYVIYFKKERYILYNINIFHNICLA